MPTVSDIVYLYCNSALIRSSLIRPSYVYRQTSGGLVKYCDITNWSGHILNRVSEG